MVIGTGLGAAISVAPEGVFGTYVAGTKFPEVSKCDIKKNKGIGQGGGLAAGRLVQPGSRRVVAFEDASGTIEMEVPSKGIGILLNALFGGTVTPVIQGAGPGYLQAHTLLDNFGKSLSIQAQVPDTTGTARPYTYKGCKVTSVEFSCSQGSNNGLLMMTIGIDAQKASEVETLNAPSFLTGVAPFHWAQFGCKLGTYGAEAAVNGVKGFSFKIERGQDTERFYANAAGLKAEPLGNDWVKVSGTVQVDNVDKTTFADRYMADSSTAAVFEFIGPALGTAFQTFRLRASMVFFDGEAPTIDGTGIVSTSFAWTGQNDLTNAVAACDYISTDTTL
jgi:hypothetical protein